MTFQEVASMIESIGLPFVYDSFPNNEAPQAPYIVFNYPNNDDFGADNINYVSIDTLNIELYESTKDFALEQTIEAVLNENGFFYDKTETYIRQENLFQISYVTEVITE